MSDMAISRLSWIPVAKQCGIFAIKIRSSSIIAGITPIPCFVGYLSLASSNQEMISYLRNITTIIDNCLTSGSRQWKLSD